MIDRVELRWVEEVCFAFAFHFLQEKLLFFIDLFSSMAEDCTPLTDKFRFVVFCVAEKDKPEDMPYFYCYLFVSFEVYFVE